LHLRRSSWHRRLQRHGLSRLPDTEGDKPQRSKFKRYPIGFFHIDIAEVRTEEGRLYLFVAIGRTSKFAFAQLHAKATPRVAGDFLRALVEAVPYKVHTGLTDNGTPVTDPSGDGWTPGEIKEMLARKEPFRCHSFELACAQLDIEHRLTKPRHPWTNGQVERMNRTIKEATVRRLHYSSHEQLRLASRRLPRRLQLRTPPQNASRPHPLRGRLQSLDRRAPSVQTQSAPSIAGTKQLAATCPCGRTSSPFTPLHDLCGDG
jgi:transposase InsO family protein